MYNKSKMPAYPGNKLLFHAIQNINFPDTIKLLEEKEADVNARNVNDCTPLHTAVMTHNCDLVELLLKLIYLYIDMAQIQIIETM